MKYLRVTMPDGSKWDVLAHLIAENRAKYYAKHDSGEDSGSEYDKTYAEEFAYTLKQDDELMDWAANNMNWSDVSATAVRATVTERAIDYEEGWVNGEKEVVEK